MCERDVVENVLLGWLRREPRCGLTQGWFSRWCGLPERLFELGGLRLKTGNELDELVDNDRIERLSRLLAQECNRGFEAHRLVIRPLRHEGIEIVDDRQNPRAKRNILSFQA